MRGKKTRSVISVSTNSNVSFCGTYRCSNLSLSSHRWVLGKWMSKNPNFKSNDDDDDNNDEDDDGDDHGDDNDTLRRGCCWVPFEGGRGGSLYPGRSGIRGPARPFASQSKTQGSPLGGYLSWLFSGVCDASEKAINLSPTVSVGGWREVSRGGTSAGILSTTPWSCIRYLRTALSAFSVFSLGFDCCVVNRPTQTLMSCLV